VYFDDFKVEHVKSPIVATDEYYPFGLTFNSYVRENDTPNKFKFQGQEHIDDLNLGWDSFKWRNHQPDIGRFFGIDPLADKYVYNSPYAFSENQVVAHRELEGLEKIDSKMGPGSDPDHGGGTTQRVIKTETSKTGLTVTGGVAISSDKVDRQYDVPNGKKLPTEIRTTDKDGNGVVVKVNFGEGFASDGNHTPNNNLSEYAVDGYVEGVKQAVKDGTCIETLTINATTNAHHGEGDAPNWDTSSSNHYTKNGGDAIDTGMINGKKADINNPATSGFQNAMKKVSNISENFGATYKSADVGGHQTWVHTAFRKK
jgi:RHS repeat-associated protein